MNLLPVFGPPTWAVLVFFRLQSSLDAGPLVLIGALAAASGRPVLAFASRRFRDRLSAERLENVAAARDVVARAPKRAAATLPAPWSATPPYAERGEADKTPIWRRNSHAMPRVTMFPSSQ